MKLALVLAAALSTSGCVWLGVAPPLPSLKKHNEMMDRYYEKNFPTTVQIVDGRVLHPSTGRPVNCQVMAPFAEHAEDLLGLAAPFRAWSWEVTVAIGGGQATVFGLHRGHFLQGVAMSRACRALTAPPATPPMVTPPPEAPDWCRGERQEWLGVGCLTRGGSGLQCELGVAAAHPAQINRGLDKARHGLPGGT